MDLFRFDKSKVLPKPHTLLIKEFGDIWDRDKSKDKEQALKELAFVFYLTDYKSVYLSSPPEEREDNIKEDLGLDKWVSDKVIKAACNKYNELQQTPSLRYLQTQMDKLEDLMVFYKTMNLNERDKAGKPIWKPKDITAAMTDSAKVLENIEKIKEKVKKEELEQGRIRAGGTLGFFEDPDNE